MCRAHGQGQVVRHRQGIRLPQPRRRRRGLRPPVGAARRHDGPQARLARRVRRRRGQAAASRRCRCGCWTPRRASATARKSARGHGRHRRGPDQAARPARQRPAPGSAARAEPRPRRSPSCCARSPTTSTEPRAPGGSRSTALAGAEASAQAEHPQAARAGAVPCGQRLDRAAGPSLLGAAAAACVKRKYVSVSGVAVQRDAPLTVTYQPGLGDLRVDADADDVDRAPRRAWPATRRAASRLDCCVGGGRTSSEQSSAVTARSASEDQHSASRWSEVEPENIVTLGVGFSQRGERAARPLATARARTQRAAPRACGWAPVRRGVAVPGTRLPLLIVTLTAAKRRRADAVCAEAVDARPRAALVEMRRPRARSASTSVSRPTASGWSPTSSPRTCRRLPGLALGGDGHARLAGPHRHHRRDRAAAGPGSPAAAGRGCRGPSGCAPATSASATCCRPTRTTPAARAGLERRRRDQRGDRRDRRPRRRGGGRSPSSSTSLRPRVLSPIGLDDAVDRWAGRRPRPRRPHGAGGPCPRARRAASGCRCTGRLGHAFGLCANEMSPSDGHVVALDHGCGAHSEAVVIPTMAERPAPVIDEVGFDVVAACRTRQRRRSLGPVDEGRPRTGRDAGRGRGAGR